MLRLILVLAFTCSACATSETGEIGSDDDDGSDSDADTDTDSDTDSDTDTDADSDADTDTDTDSDTDTDIDSDTDADTDSDTGSGTGSDTGSDTSDACTAGEVFINELHYDDGSTDEGEAIGIAGPADTALTGWSIVLYNGANGLVYSTTPLATTIGDQDSGMGTVAAYYATDGIQNGAPDGIALVDSDDSVVQFLSYEGSFTAVDGPAAGMTSIDIGVEEDGDSAAGDSLQLSGVGCAYSDFSWTAGGDSFGEVNALQSFGT